MRKIILLLFGPFLLISACGGSAGAITGPQAEQEATAAAIVDLEAAAGTAEASATSTALTDYAQDIAAARGRWQAQNINSYEWRLRYNDPDAQGTQNIRILVENGEVVEFKADCTPASVCQRIKIDDESEFTVEGVLARLDELAAADFPLAILNFDAEYGYPQSVVANSDVSPYYIAFNVDSFTVDP